MNRIPLGAFELHAPIRRGGMAEVWRGVHKGQRVPVAIKIMTGKRARHPEYLKAFRNEVQAVAGLDHPGVVLLFDHGEVTAEAEELSGRRFVAGSPYLVMELAGQGSLDQLQTRLTWPELRGLLLALLDALAHAHARGVVHRDLKPGNVLLMGEDDPRPGPKLTDFGLAYAVEEQSRTGSRESMAGTPRYMAPEMFEGHWRVYGPWTDLYALGCMTYELLEGKPLFPGKDPKELRRQHMYDLPPRLRKRAGVPDNLEGWLLRLLCKKPRERFQCAADAAWALLSLGEPEQPRLPESHDEIEEFASANTEIFSGLGSPTTFLVPGVTLAGDTGLFPQVGFAEGASHTIPPEQLHGAPTLVRPAAMNNLASAQTFLQHDSNPMGYAHAGASARANRLPSGEVKPSLTPPSFEPQPTAMPILRPPIPMTWHRTTTPPPAMSLVGAGLNLFGLRTVRFVGRERERDAIWAAFAEVCRAGQAQLVVARGAAGIGKTRLVTWVCERAHELGAATILRATHNPQPGPSNGLAAMMSRHLRCMGLSRADVRKRVRQHLTEQGVTDDYEWDALTQLVVSPLAQERTARAKVVRFGSPTERYALLRRALERQCKERPAIVVLDDVQWGSDALWFAQYLLKTQNLHPCPVLLLLTTRDEDLSHRAMESHIFKQLLSMPGTREVVLSELDERASGRLVRGLLGLESELAARVEARAKGNPLYAIELVGSWVSKGLLDVGETGFVLKPGAEAVAPEDIQEFWATRITGLLEGSQHRAQAEQALEIAAVLGQHVEANEWQAACQRAGIELTLDLFHALVTAGLMQPEEGYWSFSHSMVWETLLRSAQEADRWESHHLACARMLQERYSTGESGLAERLARHLHEAGQDDEALPALLAAIWEDTDASEYRRALEHLDAYDEVLAELQAEEGDPRWGQGWLQRVRIYRQTGRFDEAFTWAERAVGAAWRYEWRALLPALLIELGHVAVRRGDLELAENIYREAMEEAEKTQDPAVLARGLHGQGQVAWRRGDLKAATEVMRRALVVCAKHRDKQGAAEVMRTLWEVVLQRGDLQLADDLIRQALSLYEGLGSQLGVAECLAGQGMIALRMGNPAQASNLYQRAIELFESLGAQTGVAECLTGLAEVAQAQGDFLAAESWSRRALLLQEAGGAGDAIVAQFNLGLALLLGADREDDARAHFEKLREVAEAEGRRGLLACVHANLLLCAALRRDWIAWDHHISQTSALLQETQLVDPNLAEPLDRAAELALGAKDRRRALDACAMALAQWRALQKPDRLARAQRVIQAIQTGALPALPPPPPS